MKYTKEKTIIITAIICILFAAILYILWKYPIVLSNNAAKFQASAPLETGTQLSKEQVLADRDKTIEYVENIHPYFVLEEDMTAYEAAKLRYIKQTEAAMTVEIFKVATGEFLNFFGDAHTRIRWKMRAQRDYNILHGHRAKIFLVYAV